MFWSSSSQPKLILLVDIESNSVGVALIQRDSFSLPTIVASTRSVFHVEDEASIAIFEKAMLLGLKQALAEIHDFLPSLKSKGLPTSVVEARISLSSPWIVSRLRSIDMRRSEKAVLNKEVVNSLLREEEEMFKKELEDMFESKSTVFAPSITGWYINGYKAPLRLEEATTSADLHFTLSGTKTDLLTKIQDEILNVFEVGNKFHYYDFMTASMQVLLSLFKNVHSALLVNMSDEVSDFLLLHQNNPIGSVTLPLGIASIARQIQSGLSISPELAYSYATLQAENVLESELSHVVESNLLRLENKWKENWKKVSESVLKDKDFPYTVFFLGPAKYEMLAKQFLQSMLPGHEVITLGEDNPFVTTIVDLHENIRRDNKISLLASLISLPL